MQCRFCSSPSITRHIGSREAFYIWLYAGLQDTMLAVLSRVLSWCVSQSYLLLDVFFFLSLKKNPYFYSQLIVVTCRLSFSASTDHIFKHSVHCFLPSLYSITSYFMYESSNLRSFVFFTLGSSVFTFSAETLHPLSKNLYILNSLSIYQCVRVDVFTSTSTVWWRFSVVCCA